MIFDIQALQLLLLFLALFVSQCASSMILYNMHLYLFSVYHERLSSFSFADNFQFSRCLHQLRRVS